MIPTTRAFSCSGQIWFWGGGVLSYRGGGRLCHVTCLLATPVVVCLDWPCQHVSVASVSLSFCLPYGLLKEGPLSVGCLRSCQTAFCLLLRDCCHALDMPLINKPFDASQDWCYGPTWHCVHCGFSHLRSPQEHPPAQLCISGSIPSPGTYDRWTFHCAVQVIWLHFEESSLLSIHLDSFWHCVTLSLQSTTATSPSSVSNFSRPMPPISEQRSEFFKSWSPHVETPFP